MKIASNAFYQSEMDKERCCVLELPEGFVDDMVQDISDVLAFAHDHAAEFHGDKDCIVLIGHSAGAHLAVMTVLELTLKKLADNVIESKATDDDLSSRQFIVSRVTEGQQAVFGALKPRECASLNTTVATDDIADASICTSAAVGEQSVGSSEVVTDQSVNDSLNTTLQSENGIDLGEEIVSESFYMVDSNPVTDSTQLSDNLLSSINSGDKKFTEVGDFSVIDVVSTANQQIQQHPEITTSLLENVPKECDIGEKDVLSSLRLVIGLAGVYDINVHYDYESSRGVEDLSSMARAMYGPKQFDRFSPTVVVRSLPPRTRLPDIHLIHGDADCTVPESQSELFGQAVFQHTIGRIGETVIVGCGHLDICVDLMDSSRQWHHIVKTAIYQAFNRVITV